MCLADQLDELYTQQQLNWPEFKQTVLEFSQIRKRSLNVLGYDFTLQFNPARIRSIAAKIDTKSIAKRSCFLCAENRPAQQISLPIVREAGASQLVALVNPMPIFPSHFTIVDSRHTPQEIRSNLHQILQLALECQGRYSIFFNAALSGASAPDHMHYQAAPMDSLPLINQIRTATPSLNPECLALAGAACITQRSYSSRELAAQLSEIIAKLEQARPNGAQLLNLICDAQDGLISYYLFPRKKHRPSVYYLEGPAQILISPACVELAGVIVSAREQDFDKISSDILRAVFDEVGMSAGEIEDLARS